MRVRYCSLYAGLRSLLKIDLHAWHCAVSVGMVTDGVCVASRVVIGSSSIFSCQIM